MNPSGLHKRTQWNVGQGGFHSGSVFGPHSVDEPLLRYIYDCGSISTKPIFENSLTEYVDSLGSKKTVDAIFLSHIDSDHVNGLPDLLGKHGVTAERIFLPLLTPIERLLALARPGVRVDPVAIEFAIDPVSTLREMSDADIVQVSGGNDPSDAGDGLPLQALTDETAGGGSTQLIGTAGAWTPASGGRATMRDSAAVRVSGQYGENLWLLGFYIEPGSQSRAGDFVIELSKELGLEAEAIEAEGPDLIRDLLTVPDKLSALRRAYSAANIDPNKGSLVMLSGPGDPGQTEILEFGQFRVRTSGTWLLTGDAKLKSKSQVAHLVTHFANRIRQTHVISLPHHGSRNNFHEGLLAIGEQPLVMAFASAGGKRTNWAHPDASVVRDVAASSALPWVVSQSPLSRLSAVTRLASASS